MSNKVWDCKNGKDIVMPKKMGAFLKDIEEVCKKHNMSISHQDGHGSFLIEEYQEANINWLNSASKNYM